MVRGDRPVHARPRCAAGGPRGPRARRLTRRSSRGSSSTGFPVDKHGDDTSPCCACLIRLALVRGRICPLGGHRQRGRARDRRGRGARGYRWRAEQHWPREVALGRRQPRRAGPGAHALDAGRHAGRLHVSTARSTSTATASGSSPRASGSATTPVARSAARTTPRRPTICRSARRSPTPRSASGPSPWSSRASWPPRSPTRRPAARSPSRSTTAPASACQAWRSTSPAPPATPPPRTTRAARSSSSSRSATTSSPSTARAGSTTSAPPCGRQPGRHRRHAQRALDGLRPGRHRDGHHRHLQARLDHGGARQPAPLDRVSPLGHQQRRAGDAARLLSTPPTTAGTVLNLTSLFPFKDEYGVFTGGCEEANPVIYPGNDDYFPSFTGSVVTEPGRRPQVTVRQPPLNIRVRNASAT